MSTEKLPEWDKEKAERIFASLEDYIIPHGEAESFVIHVIASALVKVRCDALEEAANKLDKSAEHHAEQDRHAAWDSTRVDAELCEEHGHVYHSYPGYAAHVVGQMANVIRSLKGTPHDTSK